MRSPCKHTSLHYFLYHTFTVNLKFFFSVGMLVLWFHLQITFPCILSAVQLCGLFLCAQVTAPSTILHPPWAGRRIAESRGPPVCKGGDKSAFILTLNHGAKETGPALVCFGPPGSFVCPSHREGVGSGPGLMIETLTHNRDQAWKQPERWVGTKTKKKTSRKNYLKIHTHIFTYVSRFLIAPLEQ